MWLGMTHCLPWHSQHLLGQGRLKWLQSLAATPDQKATGTSHAAYSQCVRQTVVDRCRKEKTLTQMHWGQDSASPCVQKHGHRPGSALMEPGQ